MSRWRASLVLLALTAVGCEGCRKTTSTALDGAPSALPGAASVGAPPAQLHAVVRAEQRRVTAEVPDGALTSQDVVLRRRAARALARIADASAHEQLLGALSDEDAEVVSWAAYGVGYSCRGYEPRAVSVLVSRAASLTANPPAQSASSELEDPIVAIADALARCATVEAEATLRAWLKMSGPRAETAAVALGRMAARKKELDATSIVALLDAASDTEAKVPSALLAFSRLGQLPEAAQARLLEVARDALNRPGKSRTLALRALGRAGPGAVELLEAATRDQASPHHERADAARQLAQLESPGQEALVRLLSAWVVDGLDEAFVIGSDFAVLLTVLEGLVPPVRGAQDALEKLESLALPKDRGTVQYRRSVQLRCRAASLRAGSSSLHAPLLNCESGEVAVERDLAVLSVLDRGPLQGTRWRKFRELSESPEPRVRQAALQLLARHAEAREAHVVLASALGAKEDGTVATAGQILRAYPARATPGARDDAESPAPHPDVVRALTTVLKASRRPDALEGRVALIGAAGALQLLSTKPAVEKECESEHPVLREAAERALQLMGDRTRRCGTSKAGTLPPEFDRLRAGEVKLRLETDAGTLRLRLNADLAPVFVTRVSELVAAKFYDGVLFHRVVPGFVAQFGDPGGDGYGGSDRGPVRCETSPVPFAALDVGVALAGRDTGSSQMFVTLAEFPHLDGDYAWLGRAEGPWHRLVRGDRIQTVRIEP